MRLTRSRPSPSRRPGCWAGRRAALGTQAHRSFQDGVSQLWRGLLQSVVPPQGDPCSPVSMGLVCAVKKSRSASFPAPPHVTAPNLRSPASTEACGRCCVWCDLCFLGYFLFLLRFLFH